MRVEYTRRAIADLRKVSEDSRPYGALVTAAVEARIHEIIVRISTLPNDATPVVGRPGVHVVALVRYPYNLFYRVLADCVRVLHIRNTNRQEWRVEGTLR
jgi:plasmid stabilization system protein ParE